jgi:serine/threonine-protein kinase RsbW
MDYPGHDSAALPRRSALDDVADAIELTVPADAGQIPLVRMLAHEIAARADFRLDAIADAKMAVDEACAQLVRLAGPRARLCCRFRQAGDELHVAVSTVTPEPHSPDTDTFGWHVLTTLARSAAAHCEVRPGEPDAVVRIELVLGAGETPS